MGPFKCYVTLSPSKFEPHPPPRNADNVELYTFVALFPEKAEPTHPPPHCVTLERPLLVVQFHESAGLGKWPLVKYALL